MTPISSGDNYNYAGGLSLGDINGDGVLDMVTNGDHQPYVPVGRGTSIRLGSSRSGVAAILDFSLTTQADALAAIPMLEDKLEQLSEQRGLVGATQSRIGFAINVLGSTSENFAAAESRIRDADIAYEASQLTRLSILQNAAAAVLAQANQQPALSLQLLT